MAKIKFHFVPEPMKVIREREKDVMSLPDPYRVPLYKEDIVIEAASAYADFNNSDPFAFQRILMLCRRGIENPYQIAAEAKSHLRARQISAILRRQAVSAGT